MSSPFEKAIIHSGSADAPCGRQAAPWILAVTILGSSMAFVDSTVVNVALPTLQSTFGATVVDVQWVVESYALFLSALILAGGALGDIFGRRMVFLGGVSIFAAASVACGLAGSIQQLVIARSVQGLGAAFLVPGSLSIISASFDEKRRGRAIGTWSGFTAITGALGPVLGGWLIEHGSWRWAFFINVPVAAAVVLISWWRIPESRGAGNRKVDWLGALIATIGLGGVVTALIDSQSLGWRHPVVWGSLITGIACLGIFLSIENRVGSPMVPLALFKSRTFAGANLFTLLLYAGLGVFTFLFPMNLIQVQRYSATSAGAAALPLILLMFFLSRWSGGLVARYGARRPLIVGPLIVAAGFALFAIPSVGVNYWKVFFPAFVVTGFGLAVTVAPLTTAVMNSVDQGRAGTASGINNAVARVAGLLAIAVFGLVLVSAFSSRLHHTLEHIALSGEIVRQIRSNEMRLAAIEVPAGLEASTAAAVRSAISQAFVFGFRIVMLLCAGLALASAAVARVMIR